VPFTASQLSEVPALQHKVDARSAKGTHDHRKARFSRRDEFLAFERELNGNPTGSYQVAHHGVVPPVVLRGQPVVPRALVGARETDHEAPIGKDADRVTAAEGVEESTELVAQ